MEQMQTLRQNECEQVSTAIADCGKEILPQKSTSPMIVSGAWGKHKPQTINTPPPNQSERQQSSDQKPQNQDRRNYPQKCYYDDLSSHYDGYKHSC
uniref:Uncharacterized protein n=1 Tax=Romanomermis culicivorax TaxID=13658 RepID=A0A915KUR2_ROMCU